MERKTILILAIAGGIVLVIVVLLALSFASLEYTEYGLDYSSISKSVEKAPYTGGIYLLGLGHSFIKFPKTIQTIEFSEQKGSNKGLIQSRTSDGL